nr:MAG TPA: hypothetical protein [Caudoviricetes sp.]
MYQLYHYLRMLIYQCLYMDKTLIILVYARTTIRTT